MRMISLAATLALLGACGNPSAGNADAEAETAALASEGNVADDMKFEPAANAAAPADEAQASPISPCLMQGDERLEIEPLRAVGTEPFWSARIEGRCVTYSTPDDQQGTRIWTRYSKEADGRGKWAGQLGGKSFELRTRPEPGCSDGMSDKRYPIAVELSVDGEQRQGCAEPL